MMHDVEQNSPEWFALRAGIVTASKFSDIITPKTMQYSATASKVLARCIAERLTGKPIAKGFQSDSMKRGNEQEPDAVAAYEWKMNCDCAAGGFWTTDGRTCGASPDRLIVGTNCAIETKCPDLETHIRYMLNPESLAADYVTQTQGGIYVCGFEWIDVASYHEGMPLVVIREERKEKWQSALHSVIERFNTELQEALSIIQAKYYPAIESHEDTTL